MWNSTAGYPFGEQNPRDGLPFAARTAYSAAAIKITQPGKLLPGLLMLMRMAVIVVMLLVRVARRLVRVAMPGALGQTNRPGGGDAKQ